MMELTLFSNLSTSLLALIAGAIFGLLLQKASVGRFDTIVGQFLLKDFTVMKVILTAIVVGSAGIYSLEAFGVIPAFRLSSTPILYTAIGGAVFGIGMSILGRCPGTAMVALASGDKDMIFGFLGMIFGSVVFNASSSYFMPLIQNKDAFFHQTIPQLFSLPSALVILLLAILWVGFYLGMKKLDPVKA